MKTQPSIKDWIIAVRLRTLPLALASIAMGSFLAASAQNFSWKVFFLAVLVTVFLQILSNLANDYGDTLHGADNTLREGPLRSVQAGSISLYAMRTAIILFTFLVLASGVFLLYIAVGWSTTTFLFFFIAGVLAILAALSYTMGSKPYGYAGLGDVSVLVFFGLLGVLGTYYLHTKLIEWHIILPALSCGLFSVAVLNINNIRDIKSDSIAGKKSIPVRLGRKRAIVYHWMLLCLGFIFAILFVFFDFRAYTQLLFLISLPLFIVNGRAVTLRSKPSELDPYLKQMAVSTLLFVLTFGIGQLI